MEMSAISQLTPIRTPSVNKPTPAEVSQEFSSFLSDAMDKVNQAQVESSNLADKFAAGEITDVHQLTVAGQKASVMLQMTMQVRNKMIESYQEIMRMSI
ncbi:MULTISPECIES: flagellar hook-basal body complex protein FliE [Bacillales]|uniref:Flagellar hook-basal body complex protein FliE n=1 Tax=Brevibacillus brevis (strain 47 / JCM 6285 / NBRC 100599) TaxID=358681 RepID=C0ZFA2_BREBN|nr:MULTISPECIES: flagellar hook-basal body complex protein FliE [Bacillales]KMZ40414.1 flagellar hook-basal body protein FliE [Bacillus sp. FJAT-27238]MBH0331244.1 flagellar hook-basal body protein FliE [Brevibacillus brevis]NRS48471.1 flagellar hook-basal body complex protein FliE [Brevibacillus sp. HB2.2]OUQ87936.1 flagellar hook-basal body complex protein FliE [Brevibacillus brevis]TQR36486.1 flagellar hook-basal body complex protein FliE [Lysinibacillus sp. SDF0063]